MVIGAGSGLSASAGFTYSGERFERYFADFEREYGFHDMYSGGFYPYRTPEERWAYWSRYIYINRYTDAPKPVYENLLALVREKDYFVLTTNVDHRFQLAGFDKSRLFYTQGDYGLFQCSEPCCDKTYDNESAVREMLANESGMRVPRGLEPRCPVCGRPMSMNLRADDTFVEDDGWRAASERYARFTRERTRSRTLFLELGTGMNTPGIIKFPFWRMAEERDNSVYACVNLGEAFAPASLGARAICVDGDVGEVLKKL